MKPSDVLLAIAVVAIWGFNFVVMKVGLRSFPPVLFTALRFIFAALPLVFFIKRPAVPWKLLAGYGIFQFALQFGLLLSGMQLGMPPGLASLVIQLQVFFTIGLAVLTFGERPMITQLIGAVIAFGGIVLVASHLEAKATVIGFLLVIAAGFAWSVANILTKQIGKANPVALVVWGSLLASPPLLLASLLIEGPAAWVQAGENLTWLSLGTILFQSYPSTIIGFAVWSMLIRKYRAATIAPLALLIPVAGILSAALVLDEALQWWKLTAGVLVLGGLAINQFGGRWLHKKTAA